MREKQMIIFGAVTLIVFVLFGLKLLSGGDYWVCKDLQWVKHGNPLEVKPESLCPGAIPTEIPRNSLIEGSLTYPGSGIPKDIKVCAENPETKDLVCTAEQFKDKKYINGVGYKIEIKPGSYYVYATTASKPKYEAYYSEFVTCGLKAMCPSHKPILVEINNGQTISEINPGDWYK